MLANLVGRAHVAGPTLASLGTNFGLSPLLGKPLAIISDARLGTLETDRILTGLDAALMDLMEKVAAVVDRLDGARTPNRSLSAASPTPGKR